MVNVNQSMGGKVCLVMGATSGIGLFTALGLARMGAIVVVGGRSSEKAIATVARIKDETGNPSVEHILADLSAQQEVRALAAEFQNRFPRLDILVNNAGAIMLGRQFSVDGIELTFALNHLSYFMLTNLLGDLLKSGERARVVNVSSSSHRRSNINFDDLQGQSKYSGFRAYAQSKLANVLFTYELARRWEGSGVAANVLHPGLVATNFLANNGTWGRFLCFLMHLRAISAVKGAQTGIYLASSDEVEGVNSKYFEKSRAVSSSPASYDQAAASRLWDVSAEMTGVGG